MISKILSDKLLPFFQQYLEFYKKFLKLETDKYNDVSNNIISSLDEHVKTEQAYMLKSKGLEIERDKLVSQTGDPALTFRQLVDVVDPSVQSQIKKIYDELSQVLLDLKEINLRCNKLTDLRLHRVEIDLQKLEHNPELRKRYNSQALKGHVYKSILSKKI